MDQTMRSLIGNILLLAMAIAAAAWLIWKNRELIRVICLDENGKFDPLGGLERYFAGSGQAAEPEPDTVTADEDFMELLMRQKGAQMAGFDPEKDRIREHIIFRGRVQGVGFRYQAMYASRTYGATGWVENLPDGSVEMEVQGSEDIIECMMETLEENTMIVIERVEKEEIPLKEEKKFRLEW
jgi:acylphosphatase